MTPDQVQSTLMGAKAEQEVTKNKAGLYAICNTDYNRDKSLSIATHHHLVPRVSSCSKDLHNIACKSVYVC